MTGDRLAYSSPLWKPRSDVEEGKRAAPGYRLLQAQGFAAHFFASDAGNLALEDGS
jgi:hypothetical protein